MQIKITLKSDLCVSSGKGWSAAIDNDVCFDEYGLPYIPARRIKGCLKAAADFIGCPQTDIDRIFGIGGAGIDTFNGARVGIIRLSDAKIENYSEVRQDIIHLRIPPEVITDMFCDVRGSTQIENDTAKENSLRFVRVVSRLSPFTDQGNDGQPEHKPLTFLCEVSFDGTEQDMHLLENCCDALRNIGYKRNRGLGAVRCQLDNSSGSDVITIEDDVPTTYDPEKTYIIDYKIRLDADVAVTRGDTGDSEDYIPGSAVLGTLAGKFNALSDDSKPDFNRVFYSGKVKCCNLYITDKYGETAYPAPFYLAKYKDSDEIINLLSAPDHPQGKTPKPFKNGYLSRYAKAKVSMKVTYHHAHNDRILYTQRCIESGQVFSGRIYVSGEYARLIVGLLHDGRLALGRSKTAQYATCRIVSLHCCAVEHTGFALKAGQAYAAVLRSDFVPVIFGTVPDSAGFLKAIIGEDKPVAFEKAFILTRTSEGYHSKWNLKRPHRIVLKAGTTFVFKAADNFTLPDLILFAGEKQNEGCGMCEIIPDAYGEFQFASFTDGTDKKETANVPETDGEHGKPQTAMQTAYQNNVIEKKILSLAVVAAYNIKDSQLPNNSQLGRLSLMASNSLEKLFTPEEMKEPGFRWQDFEKRIDSIKSESAKDTNQTLIKTFNRTVESSLTDSAKLKCVIIYLHLLRYRAKTAAAEKNRKQHGKEGGAQ